MKFFTKTILITIFLFLVLQVGITHASTISRPMINSGLAGYWNFDVGFGGGTAYDNSTYKRHGTLETFTNSTAWVPGPSGLGMALEFDGIDDQIVDTGLGFPSKTSNITYTAWVNLNGVADVSNDARIVAAIAIDGAGEETNSFLNVGDYGPSGNTQIEFGFNNGSFVEVLSDSHVPLTGWHHIAAVYDGSNVYFYLNGEPDGSPSISGTPPTSTTNHKFAIGNRTSAGTAPSIAFEGFVDEVRYYERTLSAEEIRRLYNFTGPKVGVPFMNDGLVAYWDFEEGNGSILYDRTENDNDGTLTNMNPATDWVNSKSGLGQALDFDETNDYVDIGTTPLIDADNPWTVSVWFNVDDFSGSSFPGVLSIATVNNVGEGFFINTNDGTSEFDPVFFGSDEDGNIPNLYFTEDFSNDLIGEWNMITIVFEGGTNTDASNYTAYHNAVSKAHAASGSITDKGNVNMIGYVNSGSAYFDGQIDEVRVYNRALSAREVERLYGNTKPIINKTNKNRLTNGLVGHWTFDGPDMYPNVLDVSGNGNHGDLIGQTSTTTVIGKIGQALSFDGVDDYVDIGSGPSTVNSVSFWVKPETTTEYFVNLTSTTDYIWVNSGTVTATGLVSPTVYVNGVVSSSLSADEWQHVVITTSTSENASNLDIGRVQDSNYLEGSIDDLRLYSNILSIQEINALYKIGK